MNEEDRKPGSLHPFKRAEKMNGLINAALQIYPAGSVDLRLALEAIGPYKSHGKGDKYRTKNRQITGRWAQDRSKYMPKECQARGCR